MEKELTSLLIGLLILFIIYLFIQNSSACSIVHRNKKEEFNVGGRMTTWQKLGLGAVGLGTAATGVGMLAREYSLQGQAAAAAADAEAERNAAADVASQDRDDDDEDEDRRRPWPLDQSSYLKEIKRSAEFRAKNKTQDRGTALMDLCRDERVDIILCLGAFSNGWKRGLKTRLEDASFGLEPGEGPVRL